MNELMNGFSIVGENKFDFKEELILNDVRVTIALCNH